MIRLIKLIIIIFIPLIFNAQVSNFMEICELADELKETSGLLYFDDNVITHNDSGDDPKLYILDQITGELINQIEINNIEHTDWEDIAQDESYIYIGDFGNNSGNRTDLKIYRISKLDFLSNNNIMADIIYFNYEDQIDFSSQNHASNFDAEAMIIQEGNIVIFTKNWLDYNTNIYTFPKTIGTHIAKRKGSYTIGGLITGATINSTNNDLLLCGSLGFLSPFIVSIPDFDFDHIIDNSTSIISLEQMTGIGSQVEGISWQTNNHYYLSREKFKTTLNGITFNYPQKLYSFDYNFPVTTNEVEIENKIIVYPNPVNDKLKIIFEKQNKSIYPIQIEIFDFSGNLVHEELLNHQNTIDMIHLSKGIYLLVIVDNDNTMSISKICKN